MKLRAACLALLCPMLLGSCSVLNGGMGMVNRMFSAGGRAIGMGADNSTLRPLRLETGEIERARAGQEVAPLPVLPESAEHVATR